MKSKKNFSALSLLASWVFLAVPFLLILVDWSSSRQREFERLQESFAQDACNQLEKMQVSCSWEFQVLHKLNGFQRLLRQQLALTDKSKMQETASRLFQKHLASKLPAHHLLIAVKGSGEKILAPLIQNSTLEGKNLLASFAPLMDEQPCSAQQYVEAGESLKTMIGFPVNVHRIPGRQNHIRGKDEGIMLPFNAKDGVSWLYWFYHRGSGKKDETRVLVAAVFKAGRVERNYSYQALSETLDHDQAGLAIVPVSGRGRSFSSYLVNSEPRLKKFLRHLAPTLPLRQSRQDFDKFAIFSAPVLVGEASILILVKRKFVSVPLSWLETSFISLVFLAFATLSLLLIQRRVFRRGWRISIGLVLLTAIVSVFYLPAGIGRMIVKYSNDSFLSSMRKDAEDKLELNLQRLEDRYNLAMADFFYRMQHLENYPRIIQMIAEKKEKKALKTIEENVKSQYPRKNMDNSLVFLSLQQEKGKNTLWLRSTEQETGLSDMFAPLLLGSLQKFRPDLNKTSETGTANLSLKDVKDEMITDFLVQFFQGILGEEMYHRLMADPQSLIEADSTFMKISTTGVPIRINGVVRALLLAIWSEFSECEGYLDFLIANRSQLAPNFDFVALRKGAFQRFYKTSTPITPQIWDLLERTRRVGVQQTSREQLHREERLLMKSKPGKALGLYVLVGITSLKDVFDRQQKIETGFNRLVILGLILLSLLVLLLYWYFISPLKQLQAGLANVGRGDFQTRISRADEHDEFGRIGQSFNAMSRGLQEGSLLGRFVSSAVMNVIRDKAAFARAVAGERRQMTVLFASIKIAAAQDADSFLNLLAFHLQTCQETLRSSSGVIDKVMENKILVFFDHVACSGADEAVRQCFATVAKMKHELAAQNFCGYYGIATGSVVAGILGAKDIRLDFTIIGDAVNLSARLNAVAEKDDGSKIIFDEETRRHLDSENFGTSLGEMSVKGKTEPLPLYRF